MRQTTTRLPEKLYIKLKETAKSRGLTVNALIVSILWERLTQEK